MWCNELAKPRRLTRLVFERRHLWTTYITLFVSWTSSDAVIFLPWHRERYEIDNEIDGAFPGKDVLR